MSLVTFLSPKAVLANLHIQNKKQLLQEVSAHMAKLYHLEERQIHEALLQRERLGSTGIGNGIAVPHGRPADIQKVSGFFLRLEKPIDFEAIDDQPVDLFFVLLAPENAGADHLQALAKVSRVFRTPQIAQRLRSSDNPDAIYHLLTETATSKKSAA